MGLERGLRKARVLVAFVANWGLIPNTHIRQFKTTCNSSSMELESNTLFWTQVLHGYTMNAHKYTNNNLNK